MNMNLKHLKRYRAPAQLMAAFCVSCYILSSYTLPIDLARCSRYDQMVWNAFFCKPRSGRRWPAAPRFFGISLCGHTENASEILDLNENL